MSNCLDPDQDQRNVGPDLGTNCLQRLSADDKSQLARKELIIISVISKNYLIVTEEKCSFFNGYIALTKLL